MASALRKIVRFLRSRRGQQLIAQAKRRARDPRTRRKIDQVVRGLKRRH
jgi:hypothetical protein